MKQIEFKTRVDSKGEIIIPEHIKKRARKGALVNVVIFDEGVEELNGRVVNMGKTYEDRKKFWENYEFDGIWNGE